MKAIVTGANGLLGSALKKQLGEDHIYHTRQQCDLLRINEINQYFYHINETEHPDTLIHCAAKVGGVQANINDNSGFFLQNLFINNNVIGTAIVYEYKNVVNILSTCVFPDKEVIYPVTANQIDNGKPHPSNHGYSYAKRLLYYSTKYAREITGNNWISIIPTNIYGEQDNFNLENGHLMPALINKAHTASKLNQDFVVWGDGTPLRQFIYSEDLAKIILWAIDNWKSGTPMMAVNEKEYSIKDIVNIIADRFKISQERIKFDITKPNGQFRKPAKPDVPADFKFTPLDEGINKTIDWYLKNINNARK
jgi:GDP-L-fucose synthase